MTNSDGSVNKIYGRDKEQKEKQPFTGLHELDILKNLVQFTGKHMWRSSFFVKVTDLAIQFY